jgi:translation initiation factor 4A
MNNNKIMKPHKRSTDAIESPTLPPTNKRWNTQEDNVQDYDTEINRNVMANSFRHSQKGRRREERSSNIFQQNKNYRKFNTFKSNKGMELYSSQRNQEKIDVDVPEPMGRDRDPVPEEIVDWTSANLKDDIVRGVYAYGYEKPSPIQSKSISPIVSGKDVIAQAQSGTGKTGAFAISTLELIDENASCNQAILLSPTRELAIQSRDVIKSIGSGMVNLRVKLAVGGGGSATTDETETWRNRRSEDQGQGQEQVIVGTPGRIYDMMNKGQISTRYIKLLVLDEADEMLSDGFRSQVHQIFTSLNESVQVVLFSATLPASVHDITSKFMRDPVNILMKTEMVTLEGISQYYVAVNNDVDKFEVLKDLFEFISSQQCIVYCNSVKRVVDLYQAMLQEDFPVSCIHGGQSKDERMSSYKEFKSGSSRVLISTNVTSRGIDVQQVSTVINFDIPNDIHNYIHRIGRSGRWGRKGMGINMITRRDVKKMKEIETYYSTEIRELTESSLSK